MRSFSCKSGGRQPWDVPNDVLYCLCDGCHEKAEAAKQALYHEIGKVHPREHRRLRFLVGHARS